MEQRPLHWSERAKMYPAPADAGAAKNPRPQPPKGQKPSHDKPPKSRSSRKGFVITLLVILVLAAAAAVVYFWYLPSRDSDDGDAQLEARSLVRQAMGALDQAYVDAGTFEPQTVDPDTLSAIAPDVTFNPRSDTSAATAPISSADDKAVDYAGTTTSYAVGTVAADGTTYGAVVEEQDTVTITYYLDGQQVDSWEQESSTNTTAALGTETTQSTEATTDTSETATSVIGTPDDFQAMTLVRDSMTTVERAYADVGTFEPSKLTASLLQQMDPSTSFVIRDSAEAALAPVSPAADQALDYFGTSNTYYLGTNSKSGASFSVTVNIGASGRTVTYYVNGQVEDWSTRLLAPVVG